MTRRAKILEKKHPRKAETANWFVRNPWVIRTSFLFLLAVVLVGGVLYFKMKLKHTEAAYYISFARHFLYPSREDIKTPNGRLNVLVLGKGGEGHEAPDLTDSIMLVSVPLEGQPLVSISLPRDIWIPELRAKLNSVYYWGNRKVPRDGLNLAKSTVGEVTGETVLFTTVIDFSGFKKIVDALGGIEVNVRNSFVDSRYPIAGRENDLCGGDKNFSCRYEAVAFNSGFQRMDGATVLKFVRSRNSEGAEGTDLARAARQQDVVEAIKNRILSPEIFLSPQKMILLKHAVTELIETDLTPEAVAIIARGIVIRGGSIRHYILPDTLLENPPVLPKYDNLYVFIPSKIVDVKTDKRSWNEVHGWVDCVLEAKGDCNLGR